MKATLYVPGLAPQDVPNPPTCFGLAAAARVMNLPIGLVEILAGNDGHGYTVYATGADEPYITTDHNPAAEAAVTGLTGLDAAIWGAVVVVLD